MGAAISELTDVTLVIDDVDRIADRDAIDVLMTLMESLSGAARFVLTGRTLGEIPVARLVTRGLLAPFGREDLALDAREIGAVLAATGYRASPTDIRAVGERT
jgi:ATP/maltotriose-dependent transcriptional regulator MalT